MELSLEEFNQLKIEDKVRITFEHGSELMHRTYLYYTVKLYKLGNLFVELWYRPHHNRIDKVEAVSLDDVLHLYEKEIDINELFSS
ncbi:MAG TPA: hypothetical protein P5550_03325 [Bacteroidales bacterium]|nr:hypothetical protein [Bacteroidales bacterium]HRZ76628.1 hypothetical protein [Bacteroidales bacterium]